LSGCTVIKREGASFTGAYMWRDHVTEKECLQKCIDKFPHCSAVDYNVHDNKCALFHAEQSVGHWQPNSCCNRYEIVDCKRRTYFSLISIVTMQLQRF